MIPIWMRRGYGWIRSQDLLVLILMLGVVVGLWVFIELADEVREGSTLEIDQQIVRVLRQENDPANPVGPPWVEEALRDLTALGGVTVLTLVTAAVMGFVAIRRQFHAFWLLLGSIGGGLLLTLLMKDWFARARPDVVPHLSESITASFPSGHSLLSAVVYLTLGSLLARLLEPLRLKLYVISIALLFSFLVGVSRVYMGVHYPTDVLAGWTVGLMWAVFCWLAARFLQRRGAVERPA